MTATDWLIVIGGLVLPQLLAEVYVRLRYGRYRPRHKKGPRSQQ